MEGGARRECVELRERHEWGTDSQYLPARLLKLCAYVMLTCLPLHQAYQHLFYLLQTNPTYFAKLIFEMPQNKTNRFMENVILTVFNYAQNNREQYLLIKLFDTALQEEIE